MSAVGRMKKSIGLKYWENQKIGLSDLMSEEFKDIIIFPWKKNPVIYTKRENNSHITLFMNTSKKYVIPGFFLSLGPVLGRKLAFGLRSPMGNKFEKIKNRVFPRENTKSLS